MPKQTKAERGLAAAIQELAKEDQAYMLEQWINSPSSSSVPSPLTLDDDYEPLPRETKEDKWHESIVYTASLILMAQHEPDTPSRVEKLWVASRMLLENERGFGNLKKPTMRKLEMLVERLAPANKRPCEVSPEEAENLTRVVSKMWNQLANGISG